MRFGSLFAGIEGFGYGFERAGLVCAWQVERDPQCLRVLAHHWPDVLRLDDIAKAGKRTLPRVDVICGGFPCQDLSVAGKRAGLAGKRSGLFHEAIRVVRELRPALVVLENVPGLISSNAGHDFRIVLDSLLQCGARDIAWRTLDSQYFGVAQRRERVFIVADFRGERAGKILFESPCGCGHPPTRREAGTRVAATIRGRSSSPGISAPGRGGKDDVNLVFQANGAGSFRTGSVGLAASDDNGSNQVVVTGPIMAHAQRHGHAMGTQQAAESDQLIVTAPLTRNAHADNEAQHTKLIVAHTLRSEGADASEDGTGRGTQLIVVPIDMRQASRGETMTNNRDASKASGGAPGTGIGKAGDPCPSPAETHTPAIVVARFKRGQGSKARSDGWQKEQAPTLTSSDSGTQQSPGVQVGMSVRRLTPTECLRLQGFPDDHLDLDPPLSDSAKYRMTGNAVTTTVSEWIGRRIMASA